MRGCDKDDANKYQERNHEFLQEIRQLKEEKEEKEETIKVFNTKMEMMSSKMKPLKHKIKKDADAKMRTSS